MPRSIGLDVHKAFIQVCVLDERGKKTHGEKVPCTREAITTFSKVTLQSSDRVVLEATTNTWAVVDLLEPHVAKVVVSNPLRTKAIASAKVKTDKVDALVLAQLLHADYLPEVWQPDKETRQLRELTRRRAGLVGDRTAIKNRLHSVLAQRLIRVPVARLFCPAGLEWLRELELDEDGRWLLESDLRLLEAVEEEIQRLEAKLAPLAYQREQVKLLMTLPGVGVSVAQGLMAAWGDISRFPDAHRAASYLGLVPSTRQSASHCYHGRITKQGNSQARWLLIQAAQHLDRHPGPLGVFFRRLRQKKNRNIAVVATARKLATIAWHMLRNQEPYRYAQPASTQTKLAALRVQATGIKRKTGPRKGTPLKKTTSRTRRTPGLPELYESESLPAARSLDELPEGEKRALQALKVMDFAKSLQKEKKRACMPSS